ncbi:ABC transporter ATP-binding protein [Thalassotalea fusca]
MNNLLEIKGLEVILQDKSILQDVNFTLAEGDILGLVGPSGCGKTTLLHAIAGFIEPHQGSISLAGLEDITARNMIPPEKRHIGMIFQDYALFPHLTVRDNIAFGIHKLSKTDCDTRIHELLSLLSLDELADRFPHQLSGGQQQRVAIARALATRPKVILFDEPFSNIDARLRNELIQEIRRLLKLLNMTAIFVTHNKDEVFSFADQMAVMHQGRILQFDKPSRIFQQPNSWQVADFLQVGSWLPTAMINGEVTTGLGVIETTQPIANNAQLLIKPKYLTLDDKAIANATVSAVTATEHGFHYFLDSHKVEGHVQFTNLSFFSAQCFALGENIALKIEPHEFLFFTP